jgi:rod shape-determining protein MreD
MFFVLSILLFYFAAVLQTWLALRGGEFAPDLIALAAICVLITASNRRGLLLMAGAGLLSDVNSFNRLGIGMALFLLAAQTIIWLRSRLRLDGFFGHCSSVWIAATAIALSQGIVDRCFGMAAPSWRMLMEHGFLIGFCTAAIGVPILMIVNWGSERRASYGLLIEE